MGNGALPNGPSYRAHPRLYLFGRNGPSWRCPLIGAERKSEVCCTSTDQIIVLGEMHLRRVLKSYADYYNSVRTHRSLNKDAPVSRPVQRTGSISSPAILGGLHHHYVRV
jgi:hypothetical protein